MVTTSVRVKKPLREATRLSSWEILICAPDFRYLTAETRQFRDVESCPFVCLGSGFYPEPMAAALEKSSVTPAHLAETVPERSASLIEDLARPQSVAMKAQKKCCWRRIYRLGTDCKISCRKDGKLHGAGSITQRAKRCRYR